MASGDTKTEQMLNVLANGGDASQFSGCCNTKTQNYILGAIDRVQSVEDEVEELKNNPDVVDIVDTYADLQAYDTSTLTDKDIIRVLEDSTHGNGSTYYRWNATTNQFDYIGEAGGGGPTVVQAIGNSTTSVMSQNAVAKAIYDSVDSTRGYRPKIGHQSLTGGLQSVAFGDDAKASGSNAVAIGGTTTANQNGSIALGYGASTSSVGEMNIGTSSASYGYNSTNYRLLSGVHDPVNAHDAATKGYVDTNFGAALCYVSRDDISSESQNAYVYKTPSIDANAEKWTLEEFCNIISRGQRPTIVAVDVPEQSGSTRESSQVTSMMYPSVLDSGSMATGRITLRFEDWGGGPYVATTQSHTWSDPVQIKINMD